VHRFMLKSKIHRARLTGTELNYEGSISVDAELLERANMFLGEQVHVLNVSNGARFVTYAIEAPRGSGSVVLNGAAALLGKIGNELIILSYCGLEDNEARGFRPSIVILEGQNRVPENKTGVLAMNGGI